MLTTKATNMHREIATIGFSPYNRVLEMIDSNVTLYECEEELIKGFQYRLKNFFDLPDVVIVSAGIDHANYVQILNFLIEMKLEIPVLVYDQAFHRSRKKQAYRSGASDYVADPIEDHLFENRINHLLERKTIAIQPANSPREKP